MELMDYACFNCGKSLALGSGGFVARKDECHHCKADLHCCKNCSHFDPNAYNGCKESQAERVVDKDRANFCDFFAFRNGAVKAGKAANQIDQVMSQLDALFNKK